MPTYQKALIGGGAALLAVSAAPIALGFGTAGVGAGTVAAGVQSSIGAVSAGSTFATLTSLGMQGVYVNGAIAGAGVMAAGAGVALA